MAILLSQNSTRVFLWNTFLTSWPVLVQTIQKAIQKAINKRDVKFLVKHKFGYDLPPGQVNIVRKIAFLGHYC